MIDAVLDTNVLASGAIASEGPTAAIMDALGARRFFLTLSIIILVELKRTLEKRYFAEKLSPKDQHAYLRYVVSLASTIAPTSLNVPRIATHPEDDPILETTQGIADYLVTGDAQLRKLEAYKGTKIVSPSEFVAILEERGGTP